MQGAEEGLLIPAGAIAVSVILLVAALVAARRFARRKEREGAWDAHGPRHPSPPPPGWGQIPGYLGEPPTIESEPDDPADDAR